MSPEHEIVAALIGERHRDSYLRDANFHATIDQLAVLLPIWVDGIAARCAEAEWDRRDLVEKLMREPMGPLYPPPTREDSE